MLNTIEQNIATMSQNSGLNINWIRSIDDLNKPNNLDIIPLYQKIFAEPPYEESFTDEETYNIFSKIISANGFLFTAKKENNPDKTIAFVASVPLTERPDVLELTAPYLSAQQVCCYFAEDAVDISLRRQGISKNLKSLLLYSNKIAQYDTMILRTSIDSYQQIAAVEQFGANRISALTQDVISPKADGSMRADTRCFFTFNLKNF